MTYYLSSSGIGVAKEREAFEDKGNVSFTFTGKIVDAVCVGGRFYAVKDQRANIPTDTLSGTVPISAYRLSEKLRYVCDSLLFLGEDPRLILPVPEENGEQLSRLSEQQEAFSERLSALESKLAAFKEELYPTPFSFGGQS
jgi:hypothetical protein